MKAAVINKISDLETETHPLEVVDLPVPSPAANEILIKVTCCCVCHTELDEIEGRTPPQSYPMIPGHQVVGRVQKAGVNTERFHEGDRAGVAWIFHACGVCEYCKNGNENLCVQFEGTGRDANGGYAEYMTVNENFAYPIPEVFSDEEAAPLLCAGAVGYRSLRLTELKDGQILGLSGFGSSGHLVMKMTQHLFPHSKIYVFARDKQEQTFALSMGAAWTGDFSQSPPQKVHAIIDTTPVWSPVVKALLNLEPGGRLVINAIRKEDADKKSLLEINYPEHLWMEKEIKSVANVTRKDVEEFLLLAAKMKLKPEVEIYSLGQANQALLDLKHKHVKGAKVIMIGKQNG